MLLKFLSGCSLLLSIVSMVIGGYVMNQPNTDVLTLSHTMSVLLVSTGAGLFIVAFLGYLGSACRNTWILFLYFVCTLALFTISTVVTGACLTNRRWVRNKIESFCDEDEFTVQYGLNCTSEEIQPIITNIEDNLDIVGNAGLALIVVQALCLMLAFWSAVEAIKSRTDETLYLIESGAVQDVKSKGNNDKII
eukprot:TRINITY_DN604_c0_g2_i2.p3 TRINITY_DN604_c0_g2~~TRINITY_DN604_c0_g2_i2.p3  ORF type:complete len:193 (+),score=13.28 TRINITY_DN604_c0_g2_i2:299-877(+)